MKIIQCDKNIERNNSEISLFNRVIIYSIPIAVSVETTLRHYVPSDLLRGRSVFHIHIYIPG